MINLSATVKWQGGLRLGKGEISTESGALKKVPYTFGGRFEHDPGTNPEELIAAAHAACYTMFLAGELQKINFVADSIKVEARAKLENTANDWTITRIYLNVEAIVLGLNTETFEILANRAKLNCPVSRVLRADIILEARLIGLPSEVFEHGPV